MVIVHGKYDDLNVRMDFAYFREGLNAIHDRHLYIQKDNIRLNVLEQIQQLHAVVCFRDQFDILLDGKCCFNSGPEKSVIICNSNFYRLVELWSFHTILVFYKTGQLDKLPNIPAN